MKRASKIKQLGTYALMEAGPRWTAFRVKHALLSKARLLHRRFPVEAAPERHIRLQEWKALPARFFFKDRESIHFPKRSDTEALRYKAGQILSGKIPFFSNEYRDLGTDYDWLTNPDTGYRYDANTHWLDVNDFSATAGDIKYVWEKSRFSWLLTVVRYDYHCDQDSAEFVFSQIDSWIAANPINRGPNWKCSQEISLRMLNWLFALYYYKNSPALTEQRFQRILHVCYWQLHHVRQNIDFSRIAVRNNHAITETMMLYLGGIFFPFFPEAEKWSEEGKKWLEEEVAYQIYADGTYLQFSHNYHRVVVQLLTWTLFLSEINGKTLSDTFKERARKTLEFLYNHQDKKTGHLPNYGANDGALFFPLNDAVYRDYRPQLNALHYWFYRTDLYSESHTEDRYWYTAGAADRDTKTDVPPPIRRHQTKFYPEGGFFIHRAADTFTALRCGNHRDRPAQADNLHLDVWCDGINVLRDAGSYKYNTDAETLRLFKGTKAHNTVTLGDHDQMLKGTRFIWFGWTQARETKLLNTTDNVTFEGEIECFKHLGKSITHKRRLTINASERIWEVEDRVLHRTDLPLCQYWHPHPQHTNRIEITARTADGSPLHRREEDHLYSSEYGQSTHAPGWVFLTNETTIITTIRIK